MTIIMRADRGRYFLLVLALVMLLALTGCTSLPSQDGRTSATALDTQPAQDTPLGRAPQPRVAGPQRSAR